MKILYIKTFNKVTDIDIFIENNYPEFLYEKNPDIIFVSGGDGSLLHAIQEYRYLNVPFIGVANGTKNFLMNKINKNFFKNININLIDFIETSTLEVEIFRSRSNKSSYSVFKTLATNDIIFGNRIMDYNEFIIEGLFNNILNIKGMGLVFSTAIGSTAFFYNNGGKIIPNFKDNIIGAASIVSERDKSFNDHFSINEIHIEIKSTRNICSLYIDGESKVFELKFNDIIKITNGEKIKLGFLNFEDFFQKRLIS
jgi:NAD kinase